MNFQGICRKIKGPSRPRVWQAGQWAGSFLTVGHRGQLQDCVQRTLEVGQLFCGHRWGGLAFQGAQVTLPPSHTHSTSPCPTPSHTCLLVKKVGQEAAHHSLMADDQHVFLPLQLHDDRLESLDQVLVGLQRQAGRATSSLLGPLTVQEANS